MDNYYELQIKINPELEDIVSELCFENLPCEGVVLAEEAYKDLEMIATTEGTLKVFLRNYGHCLLVKGEGNRDSGGGIFCKVLMAQIESLYQDSVKSLNHVALQMRSSEAGNFQ